LKKRLSNEWGDRSLAAVWHPCTQMKQHEQGVPLAIARGAGPWLYDFDGNRYLDTISSWWVNLFGHANPAIGAAIKNQLDTLEHTMLAGCTHQPVVELSERLAALTGGVLGHAFYASDGASAVEIALKMSFHYWRNQGQAAKQEFVCLANSYHGETVGALGVTDVALFRDAYDGLLRRAHVVGSPDARNAQPGESDADVAQRALAEVRTLFEARHEQLAAIIVEPLVQCAAGMAMYHPSYLSGLRALCDQYQVHLIADEIAVGCGRTGTFFASEQAGIWPDLLCLSKGISGGYLPLSLVLVRDALYQAFYDDQISRAFLHSHSYTGNPLACTAALATLDLFDSEDTLARNRVKSATLAAHLEPLASHPNVRHLRQCGTIFAFDVQTSGQDAAGAFARRFFETGLRHELLIRPIGRTVYFMPPYVLSDVELELLAWRTRATLEYVLNMFE
jgi:adenosylmethionine-8-amino-7-oxononanoate aminotransferase